MFDDYERNKKIIWLTAKSEASSLAAHLRDELYLCIRIITETSLLCRFGVLYTKTKSSRRVLATLLTVIYIFYYGHGWDVRKGSNYIDGSLSPFSLDKQEMLSYRKIEKSKNRNHCMDSCLWLLQTSRLCLTLHVVAFAYLHALVIKNHGNYHFGILQVVQVHYPLSNYISFQLCTCFLSYLCIF